MTSVVRIFNLQSASLVANPHRWTRNAILLINYDHDMEHVDAVADHGRHHNQNHAGSRGESRRDSLDSTSHLSDIPHTLSQFIWEILSPSPPTRQQSVHSSQFENDKHDSEGNSSPSLSDDYTVTDPPTPATAPASTSYADSALFSTKSLFRRASLPPPLALAMYEEARQTTELHPKSERTRVFNMLADGTVPAVKLIGPEPGSDTIILTNHLSAQLRPHLSPILRNCESWMYLFGLATHGARLSTIYEVLAVRDSSVSPILMLIRDRSSSVFGALVSEPFHVSSGFYGCAENCFVFKKLGDDGIAPIKVFPCTGRNDYIICCKPEFLSLGGGDGENAIWIDSDLNFGHSGECGTFDNEVLSATKEFEIVDLEIWAFEP
ncbi:hypothetical protein SeLEV6574_g01746 [Synchytrium endobioticum]|uniref:Oxidation resistance protein 1 n=1 Tax=Synchytrium endobioticum TaxID=286115 RepID=A0A507DBB3_9FUNG|nr:hypothetical protein SeLEV6574_g01746 [Synchytrium endobioticum]